MKKFMIKLLTIIDRLINLCIDKGNPFFNCLSLLVNCGVAINIDLSSMVFLVNLCLWTSFYHEKVSDTK
jgi:hypothetical protein